MSPSCFSLGFISQNSFWKLSIFRGYKGYLYWSEKGIRRVSFFITKWIGDLASWLDWVASPSSELIEWPVWTFCPIVLQLARRFSFFACFTSVHLLRLASREPAVSSCFTAQSWAFLHTFSHTTLTWFPPKHKVTNW